MNIPAACFDHFYAGLVGTEAQAACLQETLANNVRLAASRDGADLYARLGVAVNYQLNEALRGLNPHYPDVIIDKLRRNTGGVQLAVEALRTEGQLYATHATVTQDAERVEQNTHNILHHVFKHAFTGASVASTNIAAARVGRDPNSPLMMLLRHVILTGGELGTFHPQSFITNVDAAGQLDITPRYSLLRDSKKRSCPAAHAKTESGEHKSAMFVLLKTIGKVAQTEIFPKSFDIRPAVSR